VDWLSPFGKGRLGISLEWSMGEQEK
jgi:hypothetical protein